MSIGEWSCNFCLYAFTFNGVDLVGLTLGASVFTYPFEMKDAFNILFFHVCRHLRIVFRQMIKVILVWLSSIADVVYITRESLSSGRIANISINISDGETIFPIGTNASNTRT
jgi:hypothetical protein